MDKLGHTGFLEKADKTVDAVVALHLLGEGFLGVLALVRQTILPTANAHGLIDAALSLPGESTVGEAVPVEPFAGQRLPQDMGQDPNQSDVFDYGGQLVEKAHSVFSRDKSRFAENPLYLPWLRHAVGSQGSAPSDT